MTLDERYVVDATDLSRAQCCIMMHFWQERAQRTTDPTERQRMLACAEGWRIAAEKARLNTPIAE